MTNLKKYSLFILIFSSSIIFGIPYEFSGMLSGWCQYIDNSGDSYSTTFGFRGIPSLEIPISSHIQFETSANLYTSFPPNDLQQIKKATLLKPYRWWIRYSTDQLEGRIGLQQINFGPCKILRPLMWFDQLDPKDPLHLTEGIYGIRFRYDFQNNANIWFWTLYGNKDVKGWEYIPTNKKTPEFGGRIQHPFYNGEFALTLHHRKISDNVNQTINEGEENRIAFDGIWDIGVGIWLESSTSQFLFQNGSQHFQSAHSLGMDYTLPIENGLYILTEHLYTTYGVELTHQMETFKISGIMITYPFGIFDQLSFFSLYNWTSSSTIHYVSWQRNLDMLSLYLSGYWNSKDTTLLETSSSTGMIGNSGILFMIIYNF